MEYQEKLKLLSENLRRSQKVNSYDTRDERESNTIAHSFLDMEESFRSLLDVYFPKLISDNIPEDEINSILLQIGEELRHIFYHIKDPKFFRYLTE